MSYDASYRRYISVISPPYQNETVEFNFTTYDADPNVSFSIPVSLTAGHGEVQTSIDIITQINDYLNNNYYTDTNGNPQLLQYNGSATFSNQLTAPTFRPTRTDLSTCIWSQAQFELTLTSNTSGAIIKLTPKPVYVSITEAKRFAPVLGVDYSDIDENFLSDDQLGLLLELASDQVSTIINNNIVSSTYLHEEAGRRTGSIFFKVRPGQSFDLPQMRRPYIIGVTSILITKSPVAYNFNKRTGELQYRFTNDLIEISEPFDLYNEIKGTYIAGYLNIPVCIKHAVINFATTILEDPNVRSLKGGSLEVNFVPPLEALRYTMTLLREYRL